MNKLLYLLTPTSDPPMSVAIYVATTWYVTASLSGWWSGCTIPTPRWTRFTAAVHPSTRGRGSMTFCRTPLTASHQVQRFSDGQILSVPMFASYMFCIELMSRCCFFRVCFLSVPEVWVNLSGGLHLWYGSICCVCPAIHWDMQLPGMGSRWDDL